ncbi:MAG TPA: hypothetical protein VFB14_12090 [Bryobacteraceae bacterium]|jgi:hypothetical protein|nr:hypothetical protein [Bryobacteraceae bacterium]
MATLVPDVPREQPENFAADLAGMGNFFIDPAGAAKRLFSKWFWIGPVLLYSIVSITAGYVLMPMVRHVLEISPVPPNLSPEQYQRNIEIGMLIQRVLIFCAPITTAALFALSAVILLASSAILSIRTRFLWLFNFVSGCALIQLLAPIASVVILKAKGDVSTMAELRPPLGLDIFLAEGTNKYVMALLGYFSVFEMWWIVMAVLTFSTAFRVSKGKAFAAILPLILLSIIFRLVGAVFQR